MNLYLLGTGTPTPTATRFGTSAVVELDGRLLMFDCGPAATTKLVQAGLWPTYVDYLFFTHHHFDHDVDYPCLLLCRWDQSVGAEPVLVVRGPPPTKALTDGLIGEEGVFAHDWKARVGWPASQQVYLNRGGRELPRPKPVVDARDIGVGPVVSTLQWQVTAAATVHAQPFLDSLAYRLDTSEGSVVFTGDTEPCQSVVDLARGADVLVSMCWEDENRMVEAGESSGQTGTLGAARMAGEAQVRTLVLSHLGPQLFLRGDTDEVFAEVGEAFGGEVVVGQDGLVIDVFE